MQDFRLYLQEELLTRCRKNPRYSLRSFAKTLGMNHGILSMVLRDKRSLTPQMIQKMGLALKLSPKAINAFLKSNASSEQKNAQIKKMNQLTIDTFNVVSDWYHDAILELSRINGFQGTPEFISKRLGITISEARAAIERLERVGLVEIKKDGTWHETHGDSATTADVDFTNSALRSLQKQVLENSLRALENLPKASRDHTCMTMAVNMKDLHEAKQRIKKFRHELMSFLQREGSEPDEVCQLAISIYPLTKLENREKTK